ncbi:hypothetical protein BGW80DRAFT_647185 [Lactifluus volemus]|nr:hypothetical protein BGW80DRAFT_647185 [Lactifluus volemus]
MCAGVSRNAIEAKKKKTLLVVPAAPTRKGRTTPPPGYLSTVFSSRRPTISFLYLCGKSPNTLTSSQCFLVATETPPSELPFVPLRPRIFRFHPLENAIVYSIISHLSPSQFFRTRHPRRGATTHHFRFPTMRSTPGHTETPARGRARLEGLVAIIIMRPH